MLGDNVTREISAVLISGLSNRFDASKVISSLLVSINKSVKTVIVFALFASNSIVALPSLGVWEIIVW